VQWPTFLAGLQQRSTIITGEKCDLERSIVGTTPPPLESVQTWW